MQILTALDHEWATLGTSLAAKQSYATWYVAEPVLAGHADPATLLATCRTVGVDALGHQALAALCRLGPSDPLARRTAVQLCMPVIARRARSLWRARGATADRLADIEAEAVEAALTRIRDLATKPAARPVYAVEGSVRKALATLTRNDHRNQGIPLPDIDLPATEFKDHAERLITLITEAVGEGRITSEQASLVLTTRTGGATIQSLAAQTGEHYKSISRRRQAVEAAITRWAA